MIIDDVEEEVKKNYERLLSINDDLELGMKYRDVLFLYADVRNNLDTVLIKLAADDNGAKHQKRIIDPSKNRNEMRKNLIEFVIFHFVTLLIVENN